MTKKPKIGDVYEVKFDGELGYFQYICFDESELSAHVIRVFKNKFPSRPEIEQIVSSEVDFYARIWIQIGEDKRIGAWEKIGNSNDIGSTEHILFRTPTDALYPADTEVIHDWKVWKVNREPERVGELKGENTNAEPGSVKPYIEIINRMKHGKYLYKSPNFE